MDEEADKNNIQRYSSERRGTIVSFSREKDEISIDEEDEKAYLKQYLDESVERFKCCGLCLPIPFERASKKSWWDPRFDSEILEGQYRQTSFSQIRMRFMYSLWYMLVISLFWFTYLVIYGIRDKNQKDAFPLGVIFLIFSIFCIFNLIFARSRLYRRYQLPVSIVISVSMCLLSLASICTSPVLSPAGDFAICIEILIIIYTLIPLPLYLCVILGVIYSITFEIFGSKFHLPVRILSHICVHLIALHILIMTNVRMRGTFMKVGQSLLVRKQLEKEKQLKERMIRSVMPPIAADWLFNEGGGNHDGSSRPSGGDLSFRPFKMTCMKNVSILFADIVGFTKMSTNKSASELVAILNELFERFDDLCSQNGCEKIATLGDCYYCVSGCPTPREEHARSCVQMGLGMIEAIAEFDQERHENVNMRVGVHTGTVLCGIVGTQRFKFDVWSNDVTLANKMESTGEPGRVHISQVTKDFLNDEYILEPGEPYKDNMATYFIVSCKDVLSQPSSNQLTITSPTPTQPGDPSPPFLSFETAITSNNQSSSLITAFSQPKSDVSTHSSNIPQKSQLSVNCMVSPFEKLRESEIFLDDSKVSNRAFSMPSSPTPLQTRASQIIPRFICLKLNDVKATSLPNVFGKDSQGKVRMGIGNSVIPHRKAVPSCKYSRLKKTKMELENGKVQQTFKSQSLVSDPLVSEKTSSNHLEVPRDDLSMCQSLNSRKDSGIKSNSRRSSIQHQLFNMNGGLPQGELLTQRVSGYYTSSQSSVNNESINEKGSKLPAPLADSLLHCQNLRKQSDLQLIKCVQDSKLDSSSINEFPLRPWSLLFKISDLEAEYREKAHRTFPDEPVHRHTLATAKFNTYFDITISLIVFICISISSFIVFPLSIMWIAFFLILSIIQSIVIFFCIQSSIRKSGQTDPRLKPFLSWYPWHGVGAVLVSLPLIAVLINFDKSTLTKDYIYNYCYLFFVGIVHYCNFTQLNCWMKSSLATIGALIYLLLITVTLLNYPELLNGNSTNISVQSTFSPLPLYLDVNDVRENRSLNFGNKIGNSEKNRISYLNPLRHKRVTPGQYIHRPFNGNIIEKNALLKNVYSKSFISQNKLSTISYTTVNTNDSGRVKNNLLSKRSVHNVLSTDFAKNRKHHLLKRDIEELKPVEILAVTNSSLSFDENISKSDSFLIEIYLDVFLLVLLIWVLNREFEISYRLSFHGNAIAAKHKQKVEKMKNQVEWLLHNIIPKHVVEQLKNNSARYSEDVKDAGIIFASVMNFSDMYDESYCNGVECLRVLNELVGDFDELLGQERFSMVEKIKTIGSTFMAASGLNLSERKGNSKEHLFQLMEFALALQGVVNNFNTHLLSFNLELRIGYNIGDVTAGVIGTKKLHYDIWGDAVNIASRMDSTGLKEKIQIPATCLDVLSERYTFEHRGQVFVKGKDLMDVYLYAGRKEQTNTHS